VLVEVAVAAAVRGTFTYRVPPHLLRQVELGRRVAVPFGRSRRATGDLVGFPAAAPAGVELGLPPGALHHREASAKPKVADSLF
jgi:primosomal protein N' (replication factor Y)